MWPGDTLGGGSRTIVLEHNTTKGEIKHKETSMITHVDLNRLEVKNLKRFVLSPSRCKKSSDSPFSTPKKKT